MSRRLLLFCVVLPLYLQAASAATQPASDPQALSIAGSSLAAMTGGASISDVTITGNATWDSGNGLETGTATLAALGFGESRVDLALGDETRTDIRDGSTGTNLGQWILGGTGTAYADSNCWTDAAWFFPALSSMIEAPNGNIVLLYVGLETWQNGPAHHLRSYLYSAGSSYYTSQVQAISTVDFFIDPNTYLPLAVTFNVHPDDDASSNLSTQIWFSNYQAFNGVQVPSHVQRYFNGNLLLDVTVTSAVFNTGLQLSYFQIQ